VEPTERTIPALSGDERTMLEGWLDYERATLLIKCEGLTGSELARRSVSPSTMSLLGLIRHMTDVERHWFQQTFAGRNDRPYHYWAKGQRDADFEGATSADARQDLATFVDECALSRDVTQSANSLDDRATKVGSEEFSLRWIMIHAIGEYARHNGHADLLRERIDGEVGY
jgi:uncharacterized damage-inducible protein DinB